MGSWAELDAYYPPGTLTPAAAFVVALGHLAGATSVYANGASGALAGFFPRHGLSADQDLLDRVEYYLRQVAIDDFLAQACQRLNPQQLRCLLINLLDALLISGDHPDARSRLGLLLEGLGVTPEQIAPFRPALEFKNDLSLFPQ